MCKIQYNVYSKMTLVYENGVLLGKHYVVVDLRKWLPIHYNKILSLHDYTKGLTVAK